MTASGCILFLLAAITIIVMCWIITEKRVSLLPWFASLVILDVLFAGWADWMHIGSQHCS